MYTHTMKVSNPRLLKTALVLLNASKTHVLVIRERYTMTRIREWMQWDDWIITPLHRRMMSLTMTQVNRIQMSPDIRNEWLDTLKRGETITESQLFDWLRRGLCIPPNHLKKLGKWGLPKGQLDAGECLETCVCREIQEEIGIDISGLDKTHIYIDPNQNRHVYQVIMSTDTGHTFQLGPEVEEVKWLPVRKDSTPIIRPSNRSVSYIRYIQ